MVTDAILNVVTSVVSWIVGLLPTLTFPSALTDTGTGSVHATMTGAVSSLWSLDAFLPVSQLVAAAALVLAALLLSVTVRIVRIVASFITLGGGM